MRPAPRTPLSYFNFSVYLCHDSETCTTSCSRRKRRETSELQNNGIPKPQTLSGEIVVLEKGFDFNGKDSKKIRKGVENLYDSMQDLRSAMKSMSGPLKKLVDIAGIETVKIFIDNTNEELKSTEPNDSEPGYAGPRVKIPFK